MIEVENATVTVRDRFGRTELDFELPVFVPARRLRAMLLETLRALAPERWLPVTELMLLDGDRPLGDEDTLASLGLWDGSILTVQAGREDAQ